MPMKSEFKQNQRMRYLMSCVFSCQSFPQAHAPEEEEEEMDDVFENEALRDVFSGSQQRCSA